MSGRIIVLEGIDGSGKSSQYRRICSRLDADGIEYRRLVFPRYDKPSGAMAKAYLNGEFGSRPGDVNAYAASTFYAVDRYASFKDDWGEYYNNGGLIFSDRYTTSNAIHQGSKVESDRLEEYFAWLADFEYNKIGLPSPDMVIYLDVTMDIAMRRMRKRESDTNTSADIQESDIDYLKNCFSIASRACSYYGWKSVDCLDSKGNERDIEEKNNEIYAIIKEFING